MIFQIGNPDISFHHSWALQIDTTFQICPILTTIIKGINGVTGIYVDRYMALVNIGKLFDSEDVALDITKSIEAYMEMVQSPKFIQKSLIDALEDAIQNEDFELAAKIRDAMENGNE